MSIFFGENVTRIPVKTWSEFKTITATKNLPVQEYLGAGMYNLYAVDGIVIYTINLPLGTSVATLDYENSFQGLANAPTQNITSDGRSIILTKALPRGVRSKWVGAGDDLLNFVRKDGPRFNATISVGRSKTVEFQFMEAIWLCGASAFCSEGNLGAEFNYETLAPSSDPAQITGDDWALVALGGGVSLYSYVGVGNGTVGLDLALASTVNPSTTAVVPLPSNNSEGRAAYDGWLDYDELTGVISLNVEQKGRYNCFSSEAPMHIADIASNYQIIKRADIDLDIQDLEPDKILPQWINKVTVSAGSGGPAELAWNLAIGRRKT